MKKIIKFSLLTLSLLLMSCASVYIPPTANIPLLDKKNEVQLEVGSSTNSLYLSSAYAITDNWALMAAGNVSFYNFSNRYDLFDEFKNNFSGGYLGPREKNYDFAHWYSEFGFGRIDILKRQLKLEIFAGGGYGTSLGKPFNTDKTKYICSNEYFSVFTQANIGRKHMFKDNLFFGYGGALRLSYSHFDFFHLARTSTINSPELNVKYHNVHLEPTGVIMLGSPSVRFVLKIGVALKYTFDNYSPVQDYGDYYGLLYGKPVTTHTNISVGVNFRIGGNRP